MSKKPSNQNESKQPVEGEGSYSATRRYQQDLDAYQQSGKSERAAQRAREAVEGDEGKELQKAEDEAKRRGKQVTSK